MSVDLKLKEAGVTLHRAVKEIDLPAPETIRRRRPSTRRSKQTLIVAIAILVVLSITTVVAAESGPVIALDGGGTPIEKGSQSDGPPPADAKEIRLKEREAYELKYLDAVMEMFDARFEIKRVFQVEGTEITAVLFTMQAETDEGGTQPPATCVGNDAPSLGFSCVSRRTEFPVGFSTSPGPDSLVYWFNLPQSTAFVTMEAGAVRVWQRPLQHVVVFPYPSTNGENFVLTAYDTNGEQLTGFSRKRGVSLLGHCLPNFWEKCRPLRDFGRAPEIRTEYKRAK